MFAITVEFILKPDVLDAFMPVMLTQAQTSLSAEEGCVVFDVSIEQGTDQDTVFLYEVYSDEDAFDEHLETPHFLAFSETVEDLVQEKTVRRFDVVNPEETGTLQ